MKYIIIVVCFMLTMTMVHGQVQLSGVVTDAGTNEPLGGVSIYIADLKSGAASDLNGTYRLPGLRSGRYLFEVSYVGYKSIIVNTLIQKDTVINFQLSPAHKELTEVIVTGVTRSTELKLSPIVVKSLDKSVLNQQASSNIIDALKNVPGMSQISTGTSISKPVIRGLGYNRLITLSNGIRQEGQQWGDEHGIELDEYAIDKIEIVKGPGSLMYGSDGIAGVLNFIPQKAPLPGVIQSQVLTNYQSNNNLIGYSLMNTGNKGGIHWLARLSGKAAGNYQNVNDGKVFNSGFQETDASLQLGVNKSWGHSHVTVSSYQTMLNLVEGERDSTGKFLFVDADGNEQVAGDQDLRGYKIGFPHQSVSHFRVASNNYFMLNSGAIHADFAYQQNLRKEFGDATRPEDIALYFQLRTFNYSLRYNLERWKGWETSVGVGGMYQTNANKGLEFLIPAYKLFDVGGFVYTQRKIGKATFAGGIRWDQRLVNGAALYLDSLGMPELFPTADSDLKFAAFKEKYSGISGSLGVSLQLNPVSTLKLNLSRGFRAPNMAELASNGRHEGTFRYEIGNLALSAEHSHQIDLGYFLNSDHISLELTPFVNFINNYIYPEKLTSTVGGDSIPDSDDAAPAFKFTKGDAILMGGELYLDIHPHPFDWLHLENSFSYVQATQTNQPDSTRYLPFIPAPRYRGEVKAEFGSVGKVISSGYVGIAVDHYFAQGRFFSAYGTETATPAYTLLSANFGINISAFKRKDRISLFVAAENLADVAFQSHLSRLKYAPKNPVNGRVGVFNMGRNVSVKMLLNF